MRVLLWLLATGTVLLAQRPAFVYVTSSEARVVAGQTLSSKAAAVDAGGVTLANQTWAWSSSDDRIVSAAALPERVWPATTRASDEVT